MEWIIEAVTLEDLIDGYGVCGQRIVRCKDCKWCKPIEGDENSFYKNCFRHEIAVHDDGFCAWGEEEEDEAN